MDRGILARILRLGVVSFRLAEWAFLSCNPVEGVEGKRGRSSGRPWRRRKPRKGGCRAPSPEKAGCSRVVERVHTARGGVSVGRVWLWRGMFESSRDTPR